MLICVYCTSRLCGSKNSFCIKESFAIFIYFLFNNQASNTFALRRSDTLKDQFTITAPYEYRFPAEQKLNTLSLGAESLMYDLFLLRSRVVMIGKDNFDANGLRLYLKKYSYAYLVKNWSVLFYR